MNRQSSSDLITQGDLQSKRGDLQRAALYYEEAVVLARAEGNDDGEMDALYRLDFNYFDNGNYQKAIEAATRLLACARQAQNEKYQMMATFGLAVSLASLDLRGRWREIKPLLLEGLHIAHALYDQYFEIQHLTWLGVYAARMGEYEQGLAWLQEALSLIQPESYNREFLLGNVYKALSLLMCKKGMYTEAIRYAEMAVSYPDKIASAQLFLAEAESKQGEKADALHLTEQVLLKARQMGWKNSERKAEYLRGELERELGHLSEAETAARQALKLAQEMKKKEEEVESLLSLGQVLLARRCHEEAHEVLKQARRLSQERNYEDHFKKAEALLGGEM